MTANANAKKKGDGLPPVFSDVAPEHKVSKPCVPAIDSAAPL